jgi:2-deoxystreptamine N-acetyl-D-glucosaminyltransferase/2-deoxystreptamine glucosyltransferase
MAPAGSRGSLRVLGGLVERQVLRYADAVITLVPRTARLIVADGVDPERVQVLPSGFEPGVFADPGADPFPGVPRPRVGYVGRLAEQKAPHRLVEAFADVDERARLVIVGDGPLRSVVEDAIRRSPAQARITRSGFVPHHQVPAVLAALDVLVLPSVYEEMGSVLVEAMACGVPVVATDVGGIPEVVVDGITGLLVPADDVGALGGAVDRLLRDEPLRERMGRAARLRSGDYCWPVLAQRVAAVYDKVLKARADVPVG